MANAQRNIQQIFQTKSYKHPVLTTLSVHDASEGPSSAIYPLPETSAGASRHAECPDCHNPHAANPTPATAPSIEGYNLDVTGVTSSGSGISNAANQYEICFKCHSESANKPQYFDTGTTGIGFGREPHRITEVNNPNSYNKRLEFSSAVSWHPVVNARGLSTGSNAEIPSLRAYFISPSGQSMTNKPLSAGTLIYCVDCHNNDAGRNLGTGYADALGPHGSNNVHLLERAYSYNTPPAMPGQAFTSIPYSSSAYAICNKCHDLDNSIVQDRSFGKHQRHVVGVGVSCSICHAAHGVIGGTATNNGHLINFDTAFVAPSSSGILRYDDTGFHKGSCYLTCHGVNHNPKSY